MTKERNVFRKSLLVLGLIGAASLHVFEIEDLSGLQTAYAQPESEQLATNCESGEFCGKLTGCTSLSCCPTGETFCHGEMRAGSAIMGAKSEKKGTCIAYVGAQVVYCTYADCEGGANGLCDANCLGTGETRVSKRKPACAVGPACPGEQQ